MKAVIMAGGRGTRLQAVARDIPKPMVAILDRPILEYQINSLKKSGIFEITIVTGHLGYVIQEHFKDGSAHGVSIEYIREDMPLGTAGALYYLKDTMEDDFVLLFGDLLLDVDWNRFMEFHKRKGAQITLYGHPNAHPYDSDIILTDGDGKVTGVESKNEKRDFYYHNFVNAGIYCVSPAVLHQLERPEKTDLEKTVIARKIPSGSVYAYRSVEYVKDMGTPDRLKAGTEDVRRGIVSDRNLRNRQKAVFLDRDGTMNVLKGFLNKAEDFELLPNTAEAVKKLNASHFLTIAATNQPVVARDGCTLQESERIHRKMETELGRQGAYLDDLFFCPHHPHAGYEGEAQEFMPMDETICRLNGITSERIGSVEQRAAVKCAHESKTDCGYHSPKAGMLLQAADRYNIDLSESWYIGDTTVDIQTGINAGMHTVLVKTGEGGQDDRYDAKADYEAADLLEAVEFILDPSHSLRELPEPT